MARRKKSKAAGDWLFPAAAVGDEAEVQSSVLDVLDNALNRGVLVTGDVVLGLADVDLIYVKLSVLLAALDKLTRNDPVLKPVAAGPQRKSRRHAPAKPRAKVTRR